MGRDNLKQILKSQNHSSKAMRVKLEEADSWDYLIIDVRDSHIFQTTPHIKGALNISSLHELKKFCLKHQDQKILLTCNGGLEASKYGTKLVESGFSQIYFLDEYLPIIQDYLPLENL